MQEIIAPIEKHLLKKELCSDKFLRKTHFGNREIYIVTAHDSPNVMLEIGRLRELSFRSSGGGTGKAVDIDEFDTMDTPYKQLVLWDPEDEEIVGGYRYIEGFNVRMDIHGTPLLSTSEIFNYSPEFIQKYLPYTIELGRSFVQTNFQSARAARKGLFSLDNLWDGLGGLCLLNPKTEYFFGKVTMYTSYNTEARDSLLYYLKLYFPDKEQLVSPIQALLLQTPEEKLIELYKHCEDANEAYKVMNKRVRDLGENVPPMFSSYIKLSSTMRNFGTAVNHHFGGVEETGILVKISDIYPEKKERHMGSAYINMDIKL